MKPRVLVAGTAPAIRTVQRLLGEEVETISAESLGEALRRLELHPDMILCNVRFDESRMMDLLQAVKAQPETRNTPFVCFHLRPAAPAWQHRVEVAVMAIGGTAFVDLYSLRDTVLSHLRH